MRQASYGCRCLFCCRQRLRGMRREEARGAGICRRRGARCLDKPQICVRYLVGGAFFLQREIMMKNLPVRYALPKAFRILFLCVFTLILASVILVNDLSSTVLLLLIACDLALLLLFNYALNKHAHTVEKRYPLLLASGLILLFVGNVLSGFVLRFDPTRDLGAIFTGAKEWAATGNFMDHIDPTCDPNYFYSFPNNLGGMTLLYLANKVGFWFGFRDCYVIAMMTNASMATTTVLLTALVCRRLFGTAQSVMALIFVLLSPPFYLIAPVFYTDSLSMLFPILILYLYLKLHDCRTRYHKLLFAALIGVSCAVGMLIKFTVLIALIAILLYDLFSKGLLSFLKIAAIAGGIIAAISFSFHAYFYSTHLDAKTAAKLSIPPTHWIMMSLESNGRYNHEDYAFSYSFEDPEERKAAIAHRILERIQDRGFGGVLYLLWLKSIIVFGDGTYAQSGFLVSNTVHDTPLHSVVLNGGAFYKGYQYVCFGIFFTLQLLMLAHVYGALRRKEKPSERMIPPLCVLGLLLFLLLWEVSGRYLTNYLPMLLVSAVPGLQVFLDIPRTKKIATAPV